tara:strand:- start:1943 stop:2761 length:819 start_codon:yes stop_codon:yes gene_type:complete
MGKESDITNRNNYIPEKLSQALSKIEPDEKVRLSTLPAVPEISKILSAYPDKMRDKLELSREQVETLIKNAQISTFGVNNTLPMVCQNDECPFSSICSFYKMGIAPKGERCPEEILYLDAMVPQLITDMGVDLENYLEINMVQEYAATLLDERRARNMIAMEGDVKEVATSVVQATGTVLYQEQITPYVDIKEKASKRLSLIRKELLATREQRAKYKLSDDSDPSTRAAEMREKFEILKSREDEKRNNQKKNLDQAFQEDVKILGNGENNGD